MNHCEPVVGQWYLRRDTGQVFEVISGDEDDGFIELQDFDGNLNEMERVSWSALDLETVDAPDDWEEAFDLLDLDDVDGDADVSWSQLANG